jgi:hypothetical protein
MNAKSGLFIAICLTGFSTVSHASQSAARSDFLVNAQSTAAFNNLSGTPDGYIVARIPTQFGVSVSELTQLAAAIEKVQFARTAHALGIVGVAICLVWWGSKRLNNPETSKTWQDHLTNAFFIGSGIVLACTATVIAAYAQKYATSV